MLQLIPGKLITHLRKLEDAGYLNTETTGNSRGSRTAIEQTRHGRTAGAVVRKAATVPYLQGRRGHRPPPRSSERPLVRPGCDHSAGMRRSSGPRYESFVGYVASYGK